MSSSEGVHVDFVADVVCPWCYVGWAALKAGIALKPEGDVSVVWRAYQLDPTIPPEGLDREAYMAAKFPDRERSRAIGETLKAMGAELGLDLRLTDIKVTPNTLGAQSLIVMARSVGLQDAVVEGLMHAYFTEGRDIGDPLVLADISEAAGLGRLGVLEELSDGTATHVARQELQNAHEAGVTGVPMAVFDGAFAVMGAQSPERYRLAIDKRLASKRAAGGE